MHISLSPNSKQPLASTSVRVFQSRLKDKGLELCVIEQAILINSHGVVQSLDNRTVWDPQLVRQLLVPQLRTRLHQVVLLDLLRPLEVQMLEHGLHFLEEAAIHENGTDAAQELVKVNVFFFALVQER